METGFYGDIGIMLLLFNKVKQYKLWLVPGGVTMMLDFVKGLVYATLEIWMKRSKEKT